MVSAWLERKIEDVILGLAPIPYADREVIEVAEGVLGIEGLPGLPPLHLRELSTGKKILLAIFVLLPVIDLEYLDLLGLDPFKSAEGGFLDTPELEGASFDRTGNGRGRPMTDGGRPRGGGGGSTMDTVLSVGGKVLKLTFIVGFLLIPLLLIGAGMGFLGDSGYGAIIQEEVGLQITSFDLEDEFRMVDQSVQTVKCFGNAACMRQWRFNNTRRPGSEEVGESYKLQIGDFSVNDGYTLDISGRDPTYPLPMDFSVYNPRHGLKGITARAVKYRVRVEGGIFRSGDQAYCSSGWQELGGQFATRNGQNKNNGTILPGGFATPIENLDSINLRKCQLLQPGLGVSRNIVLEVKYNYSSQATLYFDAMSWENMRSLNLRPTFKKSETADTPVQTYVNVESPVYYREQEGDRFPSIFRVQMGVSTDEYDLDYRVAPKQMILHDSSETIDVDNPPPEYSNVPGDCQLDLTDKNEYRLKEETQEVINHRQSNSWFTRGAGPSPVTCSMILANPDQISRSGETLTMRVDANYTVKLEDTIGGFRVQNTACERFNCPLLVAYGQNNDTNYNTGIEYGGQDYLYMSTCDSRQHPDAADGCEVRDLSKNEPWKFADRLNEDDIDDEIENGETAFLWEKDIASKIASKKFLFDSGMSGAVGLEWDNYRTVVRREAGSVIIQYDSDNYGPDVEYRSADATLCKENSGPKYVEIMKNYWKDNEAETNDISVKYFRPHIEECDQEGFWDFIVDPILGDGFNEAINACHTEKNGALVVDGDRLECWA